MPFFISAWILSHWMRLTTGPIVVPSAFGSPALVLSATALAITFTSDIFDVGVYSDGFRIMVQPAAIAGATLQAIWLSGQFHGVIMPITPIGSRTTVAEPTFSSK